MGEAVPERVHRHGLVYPGNHCGLFDRFLDHRLVQVMSSDDTGARVRGERATGKDPEPGQFAPGVRIPAFEGVG